MNREGKACWIQWVRSSPPLNYSSSFSVGKSECGMHIIRAPVRMYMPGPSSQGRLTGTPSQLTHYPASLYMARDARRCVAKKLDVMRYKCSEGAPRVRLAQDTPTSAHRYRSARLRSAVRHRN